MEVQIDVVESQSLPFRTETKYLAFGVSLPRRIRQGVHPIWNVELRLIPTEEERATLVKYKLDKDSLESVPLYTKEEILYAYDAWDRASNKRNATDDNLLIYKQAYEEKKDAERPVAIEEYFNSPYVRSFDHIQDAHIYAEKLAKELLPQLIEFIRNYASRSESVSFTL